MGGVAVLHPKDVLRDGFNYNRMPLISPPRSTNQTLKTKDRRANFISNSTPNNNRRKRSPQKKGNGLPKSPPKERHSLVMGEVKILKRGEALTKEKDGEKKIVGLEKNDDVERMEALKQTRLADFYAGSGFVDSPDPSLLPLPSFSKKNDDNGSSQLRRLLNLAF